MTGIYCIRNKINQKCYIGQSGDIEARYASHRYALRHGKDSPHLQRAWEKYGEDAFEFFVVEECGIGSLNEREIFWIKEYGSFGNGYNLNEGGGGIRGYVMSEESKRRISEATQGRSVSPEHMAACRAGLAKWTAENPDFYCKKVICLTTGEVFRSRKDVQKTYPQCGDGNLVSHLKGRVKWCGRSAEGEKLVWADYEEYLRMSPEEIQSRIDYANQKVKLTESHCAAISAGLKGKQKSAEHIEHLKESRHQTDIKRGHGALAKEYICLNTGDSFYGYDSIYEAIGTTRSKIIARIQKQTPYVEGRNGEKFVFVLRPEYEAMTEFQRQMRLFFADYYIPLETTNCGKPVVCLNNYMLFPNVRSAAEFAGVSGQTITHNLKHRVHSVAPDQNGNGLVFVYEDEFSQMTAEDIQTRLAQAQSGTCNAPKYLTA